MRWIVLVVVLLTATGCVAVPRTHVSISTTVDNVDYAVVMEY